ncbi:hypothetical protein PMAYCL1PPCAC_06936, partial [Pristionchus mayeri]
MESRHSSAPTAIQRSSRWLRWRPSGMCPSSRICRLRMHSSDKSVYKTLVRVSIRSVNSIASVTAAFIKHYNWNRVAFISNTGASAYERIIAFETAFRANGINVSKKILFEESMNMNDMVNSGQMEEIRSTSRIIIVMFSSVRDMTSLFREATEKAGLS